MIQNQTQTLSVTPKLYIPPLAVNWRIGRVSTRPLPSSTPTIGLYPEPYGQVSSRATSERTPLLSNPPVPRIEEQVDCGQRKRCHILHVLGRISNPRQVLPSRLWVLSPLCSIFTRSHNFAERIFLNILSSSCLLCLLVIYPPLH
jgi:hypothetical protein